MSRMTLPRHGAIDDPILTALFDYWLDKRSDRCCPARVDIDPVDIPALLPHVVLVDLLESGRKIRFRLVGTRVAFGKDPTGRFLHEAAPEGLYGHHISALYGQAARLAEPLYSEFAYSFDRAGGPQLIKRLFLPLSEDGITPTMLLVGQIAVSTSRIDISPWQSPPKAIEQRALFIVDPSLVVDD